MPYKLVACSLIHLALTSRSNILLKVIYVIIECNSNPRPNKNWSIVQRILHYLRGTSHDRLKFRSDGTTRIIGDYDFDQTRARTRDHDNRRSRSGYIFKLANEAISWSNMKKKYPIAQFSV